MPRMVTISSRMGEESFFMLTTMKSLAPPRSSRSSTMKPASRWRYQAMLPAGSWTNRSRSSGWLSGQSMVMMNSAFESILPSLASGEIAKSARKKRNYLQRLEQHDAERIERLFARVEAELIDHARLARSWARSKAGTTRVLGQRNCAREHL